MFSRNSYCNTTSQSVRNIRDAHNMPTFKTEVLCIVSNVQLVKGPFTAKWMANTALPCSSSTVTNDVLRY